MAFKSNQPSRAGRPLWRRLQAGYERATLSVCRLLCTGCSELTVQGCTGIVEYGKCCIRLAVCDPDAGEMVISGRELYCLSYQPDAVRVKGKICSICFCRYDGEGTE